MILLSEEIESFLSSVLDKKDYKKVNIQKINSLPHDIQFKLNNYLRRFHPKKKECYNNAFHIMSVDDSIMYVEGVIQIHDHIPIEHAWNCYRGIHFDITSEILFNGDLADGEESYYELYSTDSMQKTIKLVSSPLGPVARKQGSKRNKKEAQIAS